MTVWKEGKAGRRHMLYLDNAATTPMSLPVCKAMWQYMINDYGNPSSIYECGRNNKRAVEEARANIAGLIIYILHLAELRAITGH